MFACLVYLLNSVFKKCKWLLFGIYHPASQADIYHFDYLDKVFDTYSSFKKPLLVGDFNTEISELHAIEKML